MFRRFLLSLLAPAALVAPGISAAQEVSGGGVSPGEVAAVLQTMPNVMGWVRQQDVTLDAAGNATWTFDPLDPPPVVPAVVHLPKAMDTTNPIICNYTARTVLLVTVHCWRTNVSGLLTSLLGGTVAGAQVTLVARAIP